MELAAGQCIRQGSIGVWKHISPKLQGIGYASCVGWGGRRDIVYPRRPLRATRYVSRYRAVSVSTVSIDLGIPLTTEIEFNTQ
ncbi:hypothetical protein CRUP_019348, partial [Coryphaenoides rupestris]